MAENRLEAVMTTPVHPKFSALDLDALASAGGAVALVVEPDGRLGRPARRIDRLTRGALGRFVASDSFAGMKEGAIFVDRALALRGCPSHNGQTRAIKGMDPATTKISSGSPMRQ